MPSSSAYDLGSAAAYFSVLFDYAQHAERQGNYAIAAGLVLRHESNELLVIGRNTLLADHDPVGHAEMNAIRTAQTLASSTGGSRRDLIECGAREGWLIFADSASSRSESVLYTTLEPCPMCTVGLLNAGIDQVVIAAPDPLAGTLAPDRLAGLPPIWLELARRLEVIWAQAEDPGDATSYVPPDLHRRLIDTFLSSRKAIDEDLISSGVLDMRALHEVIHLSSVSSMIS